MAGNSPVFTQEQIEAMLQTAKTPEQVRAVKRLAGIVDSPGAQVQGSGTVLVHKNKRGKEHLFVTTGPVIFKDGDSARGAFIRAEVAREIATEILRVCDEKSL